MLTSFHCKMVWFAFNSPQNSKQESSGIKGQASPYFTPHCTLELKFLKQNDVQRVEIKLFLPSSYPSCPMLCIFIYCDLFQPIH